MSDYLLRFISTKKKKSLLIVSCSSCSTLILLPLGGGGQGSTVRQQNVRLGRTVRQHHVRLWAAWGPRLWLPQRLPQSGLHVAVIVEIPARQGPDAVQQLGSLTAAAGASRAHNA